MPHIRTVEEFRAQLEEPYAWPGGYPKYFICADGESLSYAAATENRELIEFAIANPEYRGEQWRVVAVDINWEDPDLVCAHTGQPIESAYGDPDNEESSL